MNVTIVDKAGKGEGSSAVVGSESAGILFPVLSEW